MWKQIVKFMKPVGLGMAVLYVTGCTLSIPPIHDLPPLVAPKRTELFELTVLATDPKVTRMGGRIEYVVGASGREQSRTAFWVGPEIHFRSALEAVAKEEQLASFRYRSEKEDESIDLRGTVRGGKLVVTDEDGETVASIPWNEKYRLSTATASDLKGTGFKKGARLGFRVYSPGADPSGVHMAHWIIGDETSYAHPVKGTIKAYKVTYSTSNPETLMRNQKMMVDSEGNLLETIVPLRIHDFFGEQVQFVFRLVDVFEGEGEGWDTVVPPVD